MASKHCVYFWMDGIHFIIRLEEAGGRQCILVIIGATGRGKKELKAVHDGFRENEQSWKEVLLDLKNRSLEEAPGTGHRRWGLGLLEGPAAGVRPDAGPILLGAKDAQRVDLYEAIEELERETPM